MSVTNWKKAKDIFDEALLRNSADRAQFLDTACAGNAQLKADVESLLSSYDRSTSFLETPAIVPTADGVSWRLANGARLSHFRIVEPIAAGGMGEVYLAEDEKLRRRVALKVLPEDVLGDESRLVRFQREASAVSALNHPNILTIFEFENTNGIHFFASEFVKGITLREKLDQGQLSITDALNIGVQIASALAAAHDAGVVHRDIKPENLMIRDDGLVKVLDFGLAKQRQQIVLDGATTTLSSGFSLPGMIMGTVSYMSPEQARGVRVDHRSDIFSLGIVLYEMLTGTPPFHGETASDVIAEVIRSSPALPSKFNSQIPKELDGILLETLEKDTKTRLQSASELGSRLATILRQIESESSVRSDERKISHSRREHITQLSESFHVTSGAELGQLIGRETELGQLTDMLVTQGRRLVTLTGIGGTGKTRLAHELCSRLVNSFADGYAFVRLSELREASLLSNVVARQLGIQEIVGRSVAETLEDYLCAKKMLLVLDNFEQITGGAQFVGSLLESCGELSIVVTSRERLRLTTETEFMVPPLPVPDDEVQAELADLTAFDSVRLFVERAQQIDPDFTVTPENVSDIARICSMLDGLPLAIELAAARTRVFSTSIILEKLEARLAFLTGGAIDLPERQQTMRAAVDWSYDLLNEEEKRLFRRLSVFGCQFTAAAAEAVVLYDPTQPTGERKAAVDTVEFLDTFASLADKSLIIRRRQAKGKDSYGLLEIVREYAESMLVESDDAETIKKRHALYYLELTEKAEPHLQTADSAIWIRRLDEEYDNIRVALSWSIENDPQIAARLVAAIRQFWLTRGHLSEGLNWAREVLASSNKIPPETHWKILTVCGNMSQFRGDITASREFYTRALTAANNTGNKKYIAQSLRGVGALAYIQYDLDTADELINEAIAISRSIGDDFGLAAALARLGDISSIRGQTAAAREMTSESLSIFRRLGYLEGISAKLYNLGAIVFLDGDHKLAQQYFEEAHTAALDLGEKINTRLIFDGFAALAAESRDYVGAARLSGVAESLGATIGYTIEPAEQLFRNTYMNILKAAIPASEFDAEHEIGKRLSIEEARQLISSKFTDPGSPPEKVIAPAGKNSSRPHRNWNLAIIILLAIIVAGLLFIIFFRGSFI